MNHAHKQNTSATVENKDDAVLVEEMSNLTLEKHICDVCGAKYKVMKHLVIKFHMMSIFQSTYFHALNVEFKFPMKGLCKST